MEENTNKRSQAHSITIGDIARELGCSKTTVSRAISGKGRIGKETRERILSYIEECEYKPNVIAKSLAKSKTYNFAVVLPGDQDVAEIPFFQNCLLGVCEMAAGVDYDVIVTTVENDDISRLVKLVQNHKVDGVILTRSLLHDEPAEYLKKEGIPFVMIGSSEDKSIIQIDNHHIEACKELTNVLIMQNLKKLAFIGGNSNHIVSQKRYQGFMEGLAAFDIEPNKELIHLDATTKVLVDKAVTEILKHPVDCIVCMDDVICGQVLLDLEEKDIKIPDDIKVASFYDSFSLASHNPAITAVKFKVKDLGITACRILNDIVNGREVASRTLLGYEIALKASTKRK
ncbi:maltose operon transcriptional repressor MalR, LacI family [Lachnospiraceae bacterium KM106-2]|nr:maltose operon transcriptional repressor MalR, LacI family [Lachnospiraceae bacterium KM106-2]